MIGGQQNTLKLKSTYRRAVKRTKKQIIQKMIFIFLIFHAKSPSNFVVYKIQGVTK